MWDSMQAGNCSKDDVIANAVVATGFVVPLRDLDPGFKEVRKVLRRGYGFSDANSRMVLKYCTDRSVRLGEEEWQDGDEV